MHLEKPKQLEFETEGVYILILLTFVFSHIHNGILRIHNNFEFLSFNQINN
jgi:hypothetical protein